MEWRNNTQVDKIRGCPWRNAGVQASESRGCGIVLVSERHQLLESQESWNPALSLGSLARGCIKARKNSQDEERPKQGKKWADVAMPVFYTFWFNEASASLAHLNPAYALSLQPLIGECESRSLSFWLVKKQGVPPTSWHMGVYSQYPWGSSQVLADSGSHSANLVSFENWQTFKLNMYRKFAPLCVEINQVTTSSCFSSDVLLLICHI